MRNVERTAAMLAVVACRPYAGVALVTDITTVAPEQDWQRLDDYVTSNYLKKSYELSANFCMEECNFSYLDSSRPAFPLCQVNAQPSEFQTDNEDQALPVR